MPQERIDRLITEFEAEGSAILVALNQQDRRSDNDLADHIHKLAGTAASTGALRLQALLGLTEVTLRTGDESTIATTSVAIPELLQATLAQLKEHNQKR
ncbi:hypothetical protein ROS217_18812 [Roseovarius sp. 217]|nr:hypothetical protein ROS217_18812 [Roseovarius sp. 217]